MHIDFYQILGGGAQNWPTVGSDRCFPGLASVKLKIIHLPRPSIIIFVFVMIDQHTVIQGIYT